MTTIRVLYTCEGCGFVDRPVEVGARVPGEDVIAWMEGTIRRLTADHELHRQPFCMAKEMKSIKVPIAQREDAGIGEPL